MPDEPAIRHVSDTALWVAMYRAQESERPDALFFDPYARLLAGERGEQILARIRMPGWPFVVRTQVMDELILKAVEEDGYDTVLNLAAGLDTRPYRLALPAGLRWVEVDLPAVIDYKRETLKDAKCFCRLERHAVDLADAGARRALFTRVGAAAQRVLVITEGLLIYLDEPEVKSLAVELRQPTAFRRWITDLASPQLLRMLERQTDWNLSGNLQPNFRFAPPAHVEFFRPLGWNPIGYFSTGEQAKRLNRLEVPKLAKLMWSLMGLLIPGARARMRRFSGIAVLERA